MKVREIFLALNGNLTPYFPHKEPFLGLPTQLLRYLKAAIMVLLS